MDNKFDKNTKLKEAERVKELMRFNDLSGNSLNNELSEVLRDIFRFYEDLGIKVKMDIVFRKIE